MQKAFTQIWRRTRPVRLTLGMLMVGCCPNVRAALQFDLFLGYDGTVREADRSRCAANAATFLKSGGIVVYGAPPHHVYSPLNSTIVLSHGRAKS